MVMENEHIEKERTQTEDMSGRTVDIRARPQSQPQQLETVASVSFSCGCKRDALDSNKAIRRRETEYVFAHEHEYIGIHIFSANDRCHSSSTKHTNKARVVYVGETWSGLNTFCRHLGRKTGHGGL